MQNIRIYYTNPFPMLIMILTIIGKWKIFSDNGEAGWKSLIPFYSDYIFAKISDRPEDGKKYVIYSVITSILAMIFLISFVMVLAGLFDDSISFMILCLSILLTIVSIVAFVYYYKIHYSFTIKNGAESWMMVVWIFLPFLAYFYFAFIHNYYDIPALNSKVKEREVKDDQDI